MQPGFIARQNVAVLLAARFSNLLHLAALDAYFPVHALAYTFSRAGPTAMDGFLISRGAPQATAVLNLEVI